MITETTVEIALKLLAVVVLVFLNGFFVAAEFALVKVRDTQLNPLIGQGHRRARIARRVLRNLDASLSACQLGITLASLALGWVGEPVFATLLAPALDWLKIESATIRHSIAVVVGFTVITFLHITAGEQAPKWLAIQKPLPTSLWVVQPLEWFHRISYPFIWLLNHASLWMLRQLGLQSSGESEHGHHSEEELRLLFAGSHARSGGSKLGRDIVLNALDLRRRVAREVMRPRQEIVALDTEASMAECLDVAEKTRYSRFPLCEGGGLDKTLGVVHFKDLFAMRLKARQGRDLTASMRKLIYVPETARLEKLLQLFLERRLHMAIVVDEYGGTVGMITLENILEELVGQIQDEFDQEKPLLQKVGDQTWELAGTLPLHELAELVGDNLAEEGITTTSGFVTHRLGGFPKVGDALALGANTLRVEEMDGLRVSRLRLTKTAETENVAASPTAGH
ncbi:MAG: HlyC/CorC family transporter [Verrucomicrobia bacterium]|nr:HlyC/CorC family transporter [Verrucomicrobiota bacterium]